RTAFNAGHCGAGPGRHRCARLCLVERGWAAAVRAAIGGYRAEKRAARGSAGGDRAATGRARLAEERRQGAHGSTTSGGAYHRDHEGGRGGLATPCSAPVLVLEPRDVGLGHRKPTAMGRRRAAAPPPGDRALRIARSAQARGRCASIAGVSAVTTRADVAIFVPWRKPPAPSRPTKAIFRATLPARNCATTSSLSWEASALARPVSHERDALTSSHS